MYGIARLDAGQRPEVVADRERFGAEADQAERRESARHVTLHEEIARILREQGNQWMTTAELATSVNEADNYRKKDGTPITPFQIHGRTKNYAQLFERDGPRVRLLTP